MIPIVFQLYEIHFNLFTTREGQDRRVHATYAPIRPKLFLDQLQPAGNFYFVTKKHDLFMKGVLGKIDSCLKYEHFLSHFIEFLSVSLFQGLNFEYPSYDIILRQF